jgi:P pilus assembly chaperone PapD
VRRALWLLTALMAAGSAARAQGVMIAPHAVFIQHGERSGSVMLVNPGTDPVEVTVDVFYGYTVTDSTGQLTLREIAHPDSADPSAAAWIQAFPRRLTVPPQGQQTVRLLATPPAGLPDGEYWARLAFTARAGQIPVSGVADSARIQVGLTLQVRTVIGLHFRQGSVHTGLAVSDLQARQIGDSIVVRAQLAREGDAAYLGTVHGLVLDAHGRVAGELLVPITVFRVNRPRWTVGFDPSAPGPYTLRLEIVTDREDLQPEYVLPAPPVRDSVRVEAP